MHPLYEKLVRKVTEVWYRAGMLQSEGQALAVPMAPIHLHGKFILRYHPYHFIRAQQIRRDFIFNSAGVPIRYYKDSGDYENLLYPAYWGMIHINTYENGNTGGDIKATILKMADYLIAQGREDGDLMFFDYPIAHPKAFVAAPWVSGLTQALAASFLLRAHLISGNEDYKLAAWRCAKVLVLPIASGGVLYQIDGRYPWVEEYPGEPATHVLNGCLFALLAMMECCLAGIEEFELPMRELYRSVLIIYPRYRIQRYLLYDLERRHFCNPHYMGVHALLFYQLWQSSGSPFFAHAVSDLKKDTFWPLYMKSIHRKISAMEKDWIAMHLANIPPAK